MASMKAWAHNVRVCSHLVHHGARAAAAAVCAWALAQPAATPATPHLCVPPCKNSIHCGPQRHEFQRENPCLKQGSAGCGVNTATCGSMGLDHPDIKSDGCKALQTLLQEKGLHPHIGEFGALPGSVSGGLQSGRLTTGTLRPKCRRRAAQLPNASPSTTTAAVS